MISKELLEARAALLEAEWAAPAWNPPWRKPREKPAKVEPKIEVMPPPAMAFSLVEEARYAEKLRKEWVAERDRLHATLADCAASHSSPPNNYWEPEHCARHRFMMAVTVLDALGG